VDFTPTSDLDLRFVQNSFSAAEPIFGGFQAAQAANFGFAILSDIEVFFLIQAAKGDTRTNITQAPTVTMFNGQSASVTDGASRPFVTSVVPVVGDFAVAHQPIITILPDGTNLNVTAVVSDDRRFVRLQLVPFFTQVTDVDTFTFDGSTTTEQSSTSVLDNLLEAVDGGSRSEEDETERTTTQGITVQLPVLAQTSVNTVVSVPDGGTVLMGGIKRMNESRTERGVPFLSNVPYVNRLFKNVGIGHETQNLMMMVTPRIIIQDEIEEDQVGKIETD
jgi:general secretion pathway protein D